MTNLILVSQSPRRRELIKLLNYPVACTAVSVDEDSITDPNPAQNVIDTARIKAEALAQQRNPDTINPHTWLISADTTVAYQARMLNKPKSAAEANQMLKMLRNQSHEVHTGVVLLNPLTGEMVSGVHTAVVTMRDYSDTEIEAYIATGDPMDKAGAYAIQHPQFRPVADLSGCFMGVMGLSICHLIRLMNQVNIPIRAALTAVSHAHAPYAPCTDWEQLHAYEKL